MEVALDIASAALGFVGGLILLYTSWKGAPFRHTIDVAERLDPRGILFDLAKEDAKVARAQLADIMVLEPNLIFWGALCLCGSFACALLKHVF